MGKSPVLRVHYLWTIPLIIILYFGSGGSSLIPSPRVGLLPHKPLLRIGIPYLQPQRGGHKRQGITNYQFDHLSPFRSLTTTVNTNQHHDPSIWWTFSWLRTTSLWCLNHEKLPPLALPKRCCPGTYGSGTNIPFSVTRRFIPLVLFLEVTGTNNQRQEKWVLN